MKKIYTFILSILLTANLTVAQDIVGLEKLEDNLEEYRSEMPLEKVYLHFDKPYYYSGDDIWFQVYLVAGPAHQPSPISKVVYFELIHKSGNLLKRIKLPINDGVAKGDFKIPQYFESGTYTIRAYTNWMRNFEAAFFFKKNLVIIRPYDGEAPIVEDNSSLDIGFYPEGGDLVFGLKSKVAFKLFGSPATTQHIVVSVYNVRDQEVGTTTTNSDGIGTIELSPKQEDYYARVNNTAKRFLLPNPNQQGYNLNVDNLSDPDNILIKAGASFKDKKRRRGFIIAQSRGVILYASDIAFVGKTVTAKIPKSELWTGVFQLTLFDQNWQPQAERLVFHDSNDELKVEISTGKQEYKTRDSTVVNIKVTDHNNKPVQGSFSMSVLDSAQVNASLSREHILSNLLLTSELKGYIHNPARFFEGKQNQTQRAALDQLMMTHGWRRFVWKDIQEKNYSHSFEAEQGITVKGELFTGKNGKLMKEGKVSHIVTFGNEPSLAQADTEEGGKFTLNNLQFYEDEENFLEGRSKKGRKGFILIDSSWQTYPTTTPLVLLYNELDTVYIQSQIEKSRERQFLKGLYYVDENVRDLGEFVVEGSQWSKTSAEMATYDFDDQIIRSQYTTALELIRNEIAEYQVDGWLDDNIIIKYGGIRIYSYFIDGILYHDHTFTRLKNLPAWKVKRVKPPLRVQLRTDEELMDFFRAVGDKRVSVLPGGYYKSRKYFSPRYFPAKPEHDAPDKRVLIHWQPLIKTDKNGEAQVTFFNADLETTVNIYLEGLSETGSPGVGSKKYKVKFKD